MDEFAERHQTYTERVASCIFCWMDDQKNIVQRQAPTVFKKCGASIREIRSTFVHGQSTTSANAQLATLTRYVTAEIVHSAALRSSINGRRSRRRRRNQSRAASEIPPMPSVTVALVNRHCRRHHTSVRDGLQMNAAFYSLAGSIIQQKLAELLHGDDPANPREGEEEIEYQARKMVLLKEAKGYHEGLKTALDNLKKTPSTTTI